jgi:hypothetical protein
VEFESSRADWTFVLRGNTERFNLAQLSCRTFWPGKTPSGPKVDDASPRACCIAKKVGISVQL